MEGKNEDLFFLSNGHISPLFYAVLARSGYFPVEELNTFRKINSRLQGHPTTHEGLPGVRVASGSLGQGLSVALGAALSKKLDGDASKVFVLTGDGELQEGQIWEAAMASANFKIDNLTAIVDCNRLQATGAIRDRFDLNPIAPKWAAFGWHVIEADGHDVKALLDAFEEAESVKGHPSVILARTVKGKCISFAENNAAFHNGLLTAEQCKTAMCDLDAIRKGRE